MISTKTSLHWMRRDNGKWPVLNLNSSHTTKRTQDKRRYKGLNEGRVDNPKVSTDMHAVCGCIADRRPQIIFMCRTPPL